MFVMVHTVSWLPRFLLWEPLANFRMRGHKSWDQSEAQKFSQTATSLLFFCSSTFFVWRLLSPRDWLYSRAGWHATGPLIDADFRFYYLLYSARFISDLVSIFFEDRKQVRFNPNENIAYRFLILLIHLFIITGRVHCIVYPPRCHHRFGPWIRTGWTHWPWWNRHVLF